MDAKPCEHCAEMFVPVRFATTRFCSHKCQAAQYYQDNKERKAERYAQYYQDNKRRMAERMAQYRLDRLAEDPWYWKKKKRDQRRRQLKRQQEAAA